MTKNIIYDPWKILCPSGGWPEGFLLMEVEDMLAEQVSDINAAQSKRLAHIDFRVNFLGSIGRNDLIARYGIKEAAATRDIAEYRKLAPNNLAYDGVSKRYTRSENFQPVFKFTPSQVLTALSQGLGEDFIGVHKQFIPSESPAQLQKPSIQVISELSRAIHKKQAIKIQYRSIKSGFTSREIIPFVLVNNGLRWHVRAFDRRRSIFGDFVLTRISDSKIVEGEIKEHELKDNDFQWNRIVELELIAHPRLEFPETIEFDYGMEGGVLKVNVRAAITGYLLRLWNVDCSKDHSLSGEEVQLWLRNSAALYGVENNFLAPGYSEDFNGPRP